jgi:energy-coupling factor transporter ATP-binding protein EcfA2
VKLIEVQVQLFRNILDSTPVKIQPDVTCLVGKNESGKTAFLQALERLRPARRNVSFSAPDHYPAWLEKKHRMAGRKLEDVQAVRAQFALEDSDTKAIAERFGSAVLVSNAVSLARSYGGTLELRADAKEQEAVAFILSKLSLPEGTVAPKARAQDRFESLRSYGQELASKGDDEPELKGAGTAILNAVNTAVGDGDLNAAISKLLEPRIPEFFYFSDYSTLPYSVKVADLLKKDKAALTDDEATARSLLQLAGAESDYLLNPDYERRKRELENVANAITGDVLKYWTQNPELRVVPDITSRTEELPKGHHAVIDELKIRIWDDRHLLSLPFNEHSTGFQWFFSFLAAFAEFEYRETPVVILLDEPALGLHARAQADFLRFIDERLAQRCQVIYSTHSPFMVQTGRLERVRLVEDKGREDGARVTQDALSTDPDTLFPLQSALGYDLAQSLFIGPNNLVVEGTSDFTYLTVVSDYLRERGRKHLDLKWSVVPVGGADVIPTFVALLGNHLDVTVVVDSRKEGHQKLNQLASQGSLKARRLITVGDVVGRKTADIEDLFGEDEYLNLYNLAFGANVRSTDLVGSDPIVSRLARHLGVERFDHGRPADVFLRRRDEVLPTLSDQSLERFERLFERINETL